MLQVLIETMNTILGKNHSRRKTWHQIVRSHRSLVSRRILCTVNMGQPMVLTRNQGCLWPPSTCTAVANWLLNLIIRKKRGREDDMILFQVSNFPTHRSDANSSNIRWCWDNKLDVPKNKVEEDTYKTIDQQTIRSIAVMRLLGRHRHWKQNKQNKNTRHVASSKLVEVILSDI